MSAGTPDAEAPELIELIDRLEEVLNESELIELEIEAGQTALVLRKPSAVADSSVGAPTSETQPRGAQAVPVGGVPTAAGGQVFSGHVVVAPLTGLFYASPSPGAEPYVREGGQVSAGQVIGLIEAMKLFNEIKSDRGGRVVRIHAESGALVKAKQPLIEIEPL